MKSISQGFILTALFACIVVSTPASRKATLLERSGGRLCGTKQYSLQQASDAYDDLISRLRNGQYVYNGATAYPEDFINGQAGNPEVDPSPCGGLQLYEFPIMRDGSSYAGGNPLADRVVVADSNSNPGTYEQCFLMTHDGAPFTNGFVKCT